MSLDPGNYRQRSCTFTFEELGNSARALEFLQLDAGSTWELSNLPRHYIRAGNLAEAREKAQGASVADDANFKMVKACLDHAPSTEVDAIAKDAAEEDLANPDAENRYVVADGFAFCGQKAIALRLLKGAVAGNYCAYTDLQINPIFANLRSSPEFPQLLSAAKECRDNFIAQRSQAAH
jgi:hypothetical protein